MAFTYTAPTTDRDRVRFYIGDTVSAAGPKPGASSNFTDEELDGVLATEGAWQRAVAGCYEALAALWATYVDTQAGPRRESLSQTGQQYEKLAAEWRAKYGASRSSVGTRFMTRVDGYSDDVASDEL